MEPWLNFLWGKGVSFKNRWPGGSFRPRSREFCSHIEWCAVPRISEILFHVLHDGGSTNITAGWEIAGNRKWTMNEGCISQAQKMGDFNHTSPCEVFTRGYHAMIFLRVGGFPYWSEGVMSKGKIFRERAAVGGWCTLFVFGTKVKTPKHYDVLWLQHV